MLAIGFHVASNRHKKTQNNKRVLILQSYKLKSESVMN